MNTNLPIISSAPPIVWPDCRISEELAHYNNHPPFESIFEDADVIAGVLVSVDDKTIAWLNDLTKKDTSQRLSLVIIVHPAGPTRSDHLLALQLMMTKRKTVEIPWDIRVLPVARAFGADYEKSILPPTTLITHNTALDRSTLFIGSVGNAGHDELYLSSFNVIFHPDDALRDSWRRWFQYTFEKAAPLTSETVRIPHLIPAEGEASAAAAWVEFENSCCASSQQNATRLKIDVKTGEVLTNSEGSETVAWDDGTTALNPLALIFQHVYANGALITIDEISRIKPLIVPVNATLLDQKSERTVGALKQKQTFSLQVLDDLVEKAVEKCRRISDVIDLLSYSLSKGNRWLPLAAKPLLDREIDARNKRGLEELKNALGGQDPEQYVASKEESIRNDLNAMFKQLGQGSSVPDDRVRKVMDEVSTRLKVALDGRITPRTTLNEITPPKLSKSAPKENWNQPLGILLGSARLLRKSISDPYFFRKFSDLEIESSEMEMAMNIFEDYILKDRDMHQASRELELLNKIDALNSDAESKCNRIMEIIHGEGFTSI